MNAIALPSEFSEVASICTATDVVIGGRTVLGIEDARALHAGLGVGRDYTSWIKGRISKYGFTDNVDYQTFDSPDLVNQSCEGITPTQAPRTGKGGDRRSVVYRLTLDMAKELAMVENNDRGRLVRRYFIWVDEQARQRDGHDAHTLDAKTVGGIVKAVVGKQIDDRIESRLSEIARLLEEDRRPPAVVTVPTGSTLVRPHARRLSVAHEKVTSLRALIDRLEGFFPPDAPPLIPPLFQGLQLRKIDEETMAPTLRAGHDYALVRPIDRYDGEGIYFIHNGHNETMYRADGLSPVGVRMWRDNKAFCGMPFDLPKPEFNRMVRAKVVLACTLADFHWRRAA